MESGKHENPQVWKTIVRITVFSLISIALFGLFYWFAKEYISLKFLKTSWITVSCILWAACTVFLLRNYLKVVKEGERYRSFVFCMFTLSLFFGSTEMSDFVHRLTSSYHHCQRLTKDSIGIAEFIQVDDDYNVMSNCVGYDVTGNSHKGRVSYEALVVAPVEGSGGIYVTDNVDGGSYSTKWKSADKMEDDYHEARQVLRHRVSEQDYNNGQCKTFHRIFPYNTDNYGKYLNAVENSADLLRDSAFYVEAFPAILEPIKDTSLGRDARPKGFFFLLSCLCFFLACVFTFIGSETEQK